MPSLSRLVDVAVAVLVALVLAYATLIVQQVLVGLALAAVVVVAWLLFRTDLTRRRRHVAGQWLATAAVVVYGVTATDQGVLAVGVATAIYYVGHVTRPLPDDADGVAGPVPASTGNEDGDGDGNEDGDGDGNEDGDGDGNEDGDGDGNEDGDAVETDAAAEPDAAGTDPDDDTGAAGHDDAEAGGVGDGDDVADTADTDDRDDAVGDDTAPTDASADVDAGDDDSGDAGDRPAPDSDRDPSADR